MTLTAHCKRGIMSGSLESILKLTTCVVVGLTLVESKVNPVINPNFQVSLVEVDADNVI